MKLKLDGKQKYRLRRFMATTRDKDEYRRAAAVMMRYKRRKVKDITRELGVCIDSVETWVRGYREHGIDGIRSRKRTGRRPKKRAVAERRIKELLKREPSAFGFLKGRWVVRDIAKALRAEGIEVSRSYVHVMLKDLGFAYKRPKLTVKSDDPNYHRKEREVKNYKKVASALKKGGS